PGLKVVMPSRAVDAAGLLASAVADPNPVVFVENKTLYFKREEVPDDPPPVPIGEAVVLRPGRDVTVVALSRLVDESLAAAEKLAIAWRSRRIRATLRSGSSGGISGRSSGSSASCNDAWMLDAAQATIGASRWAPTRRSRSSAREMTGVSSSSSMLPTRTRP